ncbi:activating signal cointegrator 1 complex subunit 3-like [Plakobranchus ocellatus]|uniref:Activating signal cointegrator 1 complex subunit 3-like n=1 Tax=Plakobranchus ocellatus TaxID=259542 RepID=A0AAV4AAB8_9GAST|nr:activating signal cointegrator 1 complex subunit 3-like [Plakobranchus ocellatus]
MEAFTPLQLFVLGARLELNATSEVEIRLVNGFYELDNTEHATINKYLSSLVERSLMELEASYCLEIGEDNRSISPLTLGRVASYYYLKHTTVRGFCDTMRPECSVPDLLEILSNASEFEELPVRHNEDQTNLDLAERVPLQVSRLTLDSAHTKTNILLQAHFSRLDMPSSDYSTDTKSVLDQAVRVLQAMLDVSADQGWLVTTLNVVQLLQMVIQARWADQSSLLTLPHVQQHHLYLFRPHGAGARPKGFPGLRGPVETLPELVEICGGRREVLDTLLGSELDQGCREQIFQVLVELPLVEVSVEVSGWMEGESSSVSRPLNIYHRGGLRPDSEWVTIHADQEYVLNVHLRQMNKSQKRDSKAHAPRFPKPKDAGWILVVGDTDAREVLALKRVSPLRGGSHGTRAQISLFTPSTPGRVIYTLYLLSDAYQGLDQQYDLCFDVLPPSVEAQVNSELRDLDLDS